MKNLYEPATVAEVNARVRRLRADSTRQWGKMTPAQMLAHCAGSMEGALGDTKPPRAVMGRLFGPMVKRMLLEKGKPMSRNAPTDKRLRVRDDRDFGKEQQRLLELVERFASGGPDRCTTHPHVFFGPMTPQEWSTLMYIHLDHHLRQFGL